MLLERDDGAGPSCRSGSIIISLPLAWLPGRLLGWLAAGFQRALARPIILFAGRQAAHLSSSRLWQVDLEPKSTCFPCCCCCCRCCCCCCCQSHCCRQQSLPGHGIWIPWQSFTLPGDREQHQQAPTAATATTALLPPITAAMAAGHQRDRRTKSGLFRAWQLYLGRLTFAPNASGEQRKRKLALAAQLAGGRPTTTRIAPRACQRARGSTTGCLFGFRRQLDETRICANELPPDGSQLK